MKKIILSFLLIIISTYAIATELVDIRYGSYNNGNLIKNNSLLADQTRIIFEFSDSITFTHQKLDSQLELILSYTKTKLKDQYIISDGLTDKISIFNDSTLTINITFEGEYSFHNVQTIPSPDRIVLDIFGTPKKRTELIENKPIIKQIQPKNILSSNERNNVKTELDPLEIASFFKNNEKLFMDLYEIPIDLVVRYFSKESKYDIYLDNSISGDVSLNFKNQTLGSAFKLLLESKGLSYYKKDDTIIVTTASQTTKNNFVQYSTYLKNVNVNNIKDFIKEKYPDAKNILTNNITNYIELEVPEAEVSSVDSLIHYYENNYPHFKLNFYIFYLSRPQLNLLKNNNNISSIRYLTDHSMKYKIIDSIFVNINQLNNFSFIRKLPFKLKKDFENMECGFETFSKINFSEEKLLHLSLNYKIYTVGKNRNQSIIAKTQSINLDKNEVLILYDEDFLNSTEFIQDWSDTEINFISTKDSIPVIGIFPDIKK